MPRGRHRHSPPLHRVLPPAAIAGVCVVCSAGPWLFTDLWVLRALSVAVALVAVFGATLMRRWDVAAGKRVADLQRARASDAWQHEERVAELEGDLDESRVVRAKLEQRLRAKRAELQGLRNEHAALLRRYATAETERASALEGRRLLEIESATPRRALPAAVPVPARAVADAVPEPVADPSVESAASAEFAESVASVESVESSTDVAESPARARVLGGTLFSPEGTELFRSAGRALARIAAGETEEQGEDGAPGENGASGEENGPKEDDDQGAEPVESTEAEPAEPTRAEPSDPQAQPAVAGPATPDGPDSQERLEGSDRPVAPTAPAPAEVAETSAAPRDAGEGEHSAAGLVPRQTGSRPQASVTPPRRPSGHFTVPTAVAVVPETPSRRPVVEGGFDFFGTQKGEAGGGHSGATGVTDSTEAADAKRDQDDKHGQGDKHGQDDQGHRHETGDRYDADDRDDTDHRDDAGRHLRTAAS